MRTIKLLIVPLVAILLVVAFSYLSSVKHDKNNGNDTNVNLGYFRLYYTPENASPINLLDSNEQLISSISVSGAAVGLPLGNASYTLRSADFDDINLNITTYKDAVVESTVAFTNKKTSTESDLVDVLSSKNSVITLSGGYRLKNVKIIENEWATGRLFSSRPGVEGEVVLARLRNNSWDILFSGSYFDTESLVNLGVPQNIIDVLFGASQ
ncbi:hypothetical protein KC960_04335 [Candidatus Saccharibacteria bacterium]|nr:hypothetical protein [Candidatus Saccharibacteria bacterium]